MSDTLRNQLLGLGFKPAASPEKARSKKGRQEKAKPPRAESSAPARRPGAEARKHAREDIDLAKAYAIRAQREKQERIEAERQKQEQARQRRESREKLVVLLEGKALNAPDAEIARHFEYGGKIKRIHVTPDQLKGLNAGRLGVVQSNGRYLLVELDVLAEAEAVFPAAVALKVDPEAPAGDDPYADPQYQVPDDLVW